MSHEVFPVIHEGYLFCTVLTTRAGFVATIFQDI